MHGKTMKEALNEVRSFRDVDIEEVRPKPRAWPVTKEGGPGSGPQKGGKKYSSADIKKAYGILNDPRYKQGNFSGAAKAIDKLSPGLSDHPDVKNAMKRANEALDLPATGDTTTSNASQEDIVEKNINEVAPIAIAAVIARVLGTTVAKNASSAVKKALSTTATVAKPTAVATTAAAGAPTTTMPESTENNKVDTTEGYDTGNTRPRDSRGSRLPLNKYPKPKSTIPVPSMNYVGSLTSQKNESKLSTAQLDTLKQKYSGLSGSEKNGIQMDKLAKIMKRYPESMLDQLAALDIPMVSKVAKSMTEAVVGLPFSRTLMYIIKTDRNTATRIKSFLADNGERYPIHIDDNGSGQITLDAYEYTGGEKKAALAAAQAIAKKFNVKVHATR